MPCWMKTESGIDIQKPNRELLELALKDLGYTINQETYSRNAGYAFSADHFGQKHRCSVVIKHDGTLSLIRSNSTSLTEHALIVELKKAYSTQVVKKAAATMRWTLKETAPGKFVALRRTS